MATSEGQVFGEVEHRELLIPPLRTPLNGSSEPIGDINQNRSHDAGLARTGGAREPSTAASLQPTEELTRQMCLCVGLGAGGGIDSSELKLLLGSHVVDLGDEGIRIDLPGSRARTVWVLREYELLVRRGLVGTRAHHPVLGRKQDRRNVAADVFSRAKLYGDLPGLEQSRLRTTWLATLLSRPVPPAIIFTIAGLKSTRTLFDLLPHLPATDDTTVLRDGGTR